MNRTFVALISSVYLTTAVTGVVFAQAYPNKPIRLIVPSAPGTPPDIRARWLGEKLGPSLGQPIIVDNKAGAAGIIGTEAASRSAADGYTLVMCHQGTLALNPHLYPQLPYDPIKGFSPVARLVVSAMVLGVHPSVPADTIADLIRLAKEKPGQLNWGIWDRRIAALHSGGTFPTNGQD